MRRYALALLLPFLLAACSSGAPSASGSPPAASQAEPSAALPSAPGASTVGDPGGPSTGDGKVDVQIEGGPDAGTYSATGETNCTKDFIGEGAWGVQFSLTEGADKDLTSVQLVYNEQGQQGEDMFAGTKLLLTVTIGPLFDTGRSYEIDVKTDDSGEESKGEGTAEVTEGIDDATIHAMGTTAEDVALDVTIDCGGLVGT